MTPLRRLLEEYARLAAEERRRRKRARIIRFTLRRRLAMFVAFESCSMRILRSFNRGDRAGGTPLHRATAGSAREVITLLLDRGADIHAIHGVGLGCPRGFAPYDVQAIDIALWGGFGTKAPASTLENPGLQCSIFRLATGSRLSPAAL